MYSYRYKYRRPAMTFIWWPIALIVITNTLYQLCTKSVPGGMNPLAALTVTYTVSAVGSLILFFALNKNADLLGEYSKLNWAPFALGISIIGLELGYIYAFKVGWPISTTQIVQAAIVAGLLIVIGVLFYREALTWNRILGVAICLVGLYVINLK